MDIQIVNIFVEAVAGYNGSRYSTSQMPLPWKLG